jgi:hypothetical protein
MSFSVIFECNSYKSHYGGLTVGSKTSNLILKIGGGKHFFNLVLIFCTTHSMMSLFSNFSSIKMFYTILVILLEIEKPLWNIKWFLLSL